MAPPSTFFTLVISGDIFGDPDPFVNSYFGISFDLRCYLTQSNIFEVVKQSLKQNNFRFLHSELATRCIFGAIFAQVPKGILWRYPRWKTFSGSNKGPILAKMLKLGNFDSFLSQKMALAQKIGAVAPIFCIIICVIMIHEKQWLSGSLLSK